MAPTPIYSTSDSRNYDTPLDHIFFMACNNNQNNSNVMITFSPYDQTAFYAIASMITKTESVWFFPFLNPIIHTCTLMYTNLFRESIDVKYNFLHLRYKQGENYNCRV